MSSTVSHGLVCLLHDDPRGSFRSMRAGGLTQPYEITTEVRQTLASVYHDNVTRLEVLLRYISELGFTSYRVSSAIFPLMTHGVYADVAHEILHNEIFDRLDCVDTYGVELSTHPGQFTMLTSLNDSVNENSIAELEMWATIAKHLPINLVNIHGGALRDGFDVHRRIFDKNVNRLSPEARHLLSLENDEKSYSASKISSLCVEHGLMMVLDYHHERCYQRRVNGFNRTFTDTALAAMDMLGTALSTYKGRVASPLAHLSSPLGGWNDPNFKNLCAHADYIDPDDYPLELMDEGLKDKLERVGHARLRLDIEAKHKQMAICQLNEWKTSHGH